MHDPEDLIKIFNACFKVSHQTCLVRGDDEPIYLPKNDTCDHHRIIFAHGFFSSALHECAHWFIAGKARRMQEDYGYWYVPDGREQAQQSLFEQVEVKPQALEWIFSRAAKHRFQFSLDNLNGAPADIRLLSKLAAESEVRGDSERRTGAYMQVHEDSSTESTKQFASAVAFREKSIDAFQQKVYTQAHYYLSEGLPQRAGVFYAALLRHYKTFEIAQPAVCDRFGREWVFLNQPASHLLDYRQESVVTL